LTSIYIADDGNATKIKMFTLLRTSSVYNLDLTLIDPSGNMVELLPPKTSTIMDGFELMTVFDDEATAALKI